MVTPRGHCLLWSKAHYQSLCNWTPQRPGTVLGPAHPTQPTHGGRDCNPHLQMKKVRVREAPCLTQGPELITIRAHILDTGQSTPKLFNSLPALFANSPNNDLNSSIKIPSIPIDHGCFLWEIIGYSRYFQTINGLRASILKCHLSDGSSWASWGASSVSLFTPCEAGGSMLGGCANQWSVHLHMLHWTHRVFRKTEPTV